MPRKPVDYSKTVIYKIVCNDLEIKDLYVGSTSNFRIRKNCHKSNCNNEKGKKYKLKVYTTIRANGGWENYSMIEIEKYPCKDGNEALARERYWYEELKAKLNTLSPTLNVEKRKEKRKEYHKIYDATEERKEYFKTRNTTEEQKEYMKKYEATHREEIKEYKKKYEATHREEINRKARERYAKKKAKKILISPV
jgi:hypothetical protein